MRLREAILAKRPWTSWATFALAVACLVMSLAPMALVKDIPAVDQPNHLASIAAWNHYDDPAYGISEHYELDVRPDPYFIYYGSVHLLSYVMPIRWANKVFIACSIFGCALGLRALLAAHKKPAILALAALPLAWNYNMAAGFISSIAATGVMLWAFALIARWEDASPWPTWKHWAASAAMGFLLYLSHFLAWMVWAPILVYRKRGLGVLALLPSAPLFLVQSDRPDVNQRFEVHARWAENLPTDFPELLFSYVRGWPLAILIAGLAVALILAWRLTEREPAQTDKRPWILCGIAVVFFTALPFVLFKPFYWSNINVRLAPLAAMIFVATVPRGRLSGWRATAVVAPICAVIVAYFFFVRPDFLRWEKNTRDFYAVIEKLPLNPDVFVDVQTNMRDDVLRKQIWRQYGSYVGLEKGSEKYSGWHRGFPLSVRKGHERAVSLTRAKPEQFRYLVIRQKKPSKEMKGWTKLAQAGLWSLWENQSIAPPAASEGGPVAPDEGGTGL
jgi:hypothetical protein